MVKSKVKFKIAGKKCDISYTEQDFETEKLHREWAWGDGKTFKSFFLETILCQNYETLEVPTQTVFWQFYSQITEIYNRVSVFWNLKS